MTPEELRDLIERAGITQTYAADLAGVALRTMQQYLAGKTRIPRSVSGLLVVWLHRRDWLPPSRMGDWLHPDIARVL